MSDRKPVFRILADLVIAAMISGSIVYAGWAVARRVPIAEAAPACECRCTASCVLPGADGGAR